MRMRCLSWLCLAIMLITTTATHVVARRAVAAAERDQLEAKARDMAAIAAQVGSRIDQSLASIHAVVAATGGDAGAFVRAAEANIASGLFSTAALLDVSGGAPAVALEVGAPLRLTESGLGADVLRAKEPSGRAELTPVGRLTTATGNVFGFSYGPVEGTPLLVYAELPLANIPQLILRDLGDPRRASGLADLSLAVYADGAERQESLVVAFAPSLPLTGDRFVQPLRVGSGTWSLVMAANGSLLGRVEVALPWILAVGGLIASVLLAGIVEVTLRRRAATRRSERRFRLLVEHSSDFITVVDRDMTILSISDAVTAILGHAPDDLVGTSVVDLVHPDDVADLVQHGGDGKPLFLAARFRHAGGSWRDLEITGTNLLDEPAVAGVVLNCRDVTERRAVEAARSKLASIVESTSDLVGTMDTRGQITYLNPAGLDLLGLQPDGLGQVLVASVVSDPLRLAESIEGAERDGVWSGETTLVSVTGREIPAWSVVLAHRNGAGVVDGFSTITRDISERKSLEDQLAHQAFHDPLTDLANRALLADRLGHALQRAARLGHPLSVLVLDLDDFKTVNDGLGHGAGDELLVALAERLGRCVRAEDTFACLGGDEFALVLEDTGEVGAVDAAERLLAALRSPFRVADKEVFATTSVGIAVSAPGAAPDPESLLRDADAAMYEAKAEGKGRWQLFVPDMRTAALDRLGLGVALRAAVDQEQFVLHYQPIVDLATGGVRGFEALLRWMHPTEGLMHPLRFIPLVEETGLIVPIGRWVLSEACRQLWAWEEQTPSARSLHVSVNVSGRQLRDPEFLHVVEDALRTTGVRPDRLVLEITESVLVQCSDAAMDRLHQVKGLGVRLAMDDFGTGYSSLGALQSLPVDILKIDKSFIDAIGSPKDGSSLVRTIIQLGQALELEVVAEGIEQQDQALHLTGLGCRLGQGYFFAPGLEPDQARSLLDGTATFRGPARPGQLPMEQLERPSH